MHSSPGRLCRRPKVYSRAMSNPSGEMSILIDSHCHLDFPDFAPDLEAIAGVLHCFTAGRELALRAVDLGFYIGFTGILTFKNSDELRAIATELPADRILVETDAPYLAPGKFRGKRNEPAYVTETARTLAATRGVTFDEIARQTTEHFLP